MRLYRVMANIRAGAAEQKAQPGQLGLVTVWIRSETEEEALSRAQRIIADRAYDSVAELTVYLEQSGTLPTAGESTGGDTVRSGYLAMRQEAMDRGDGLFELWYPTEAS